MVRLHCLLCLALLLAALPAAGQAPDMPPVFAHPDPAIARKFPGEKGFYRFLLEAKAGRIRSCSAEMAYLLFRFNARMEVDTVLTFGTMNDTLLAPFRRRIQESIRYWKPGKSVATKWYLMPFFQMYILEKIARPICRLCWPMG